MNKDVINQALNKYGVEHQLDRVVEELGELIVEVAKYKRGYHNRFPIVTEMADVLICMEYLKIILDLQEEDIQEQIEYKLERLKYRMEVNQ